MHLEEKNLLRFFEIVGIFFVIVGSIAVSLITMIWKLPVENILAAILSLFAAFGLYQLAANICMERQITSLSQEGLSKELNQNEWYYELAPVILSAKDRIDITQHQGLIPADSRIKAKRDLFKILSKKIDKGNVMVRWIVAINNIEKFNWVDSLIKKHSACDNFSLAYSPVDLEYTAPPLSVQIIDNLHVFIIDMSKGHHTESQWDIDIRSSNIDMIKQFQGYYDTYWSRCVKLKDGREIFNRKIEELKNSLSKGETV